ncbi:MAG: MMPL family transporter [Pseudomonadota bacterium]
MVKRSGPRTVNIPLLMITVLAAAAMLVAGLRGLDIETDIVASLPVKNPVIKDALFFFKHHPIQDRVVISVTLGTQDPDRLVDCAAMVEDRLRESGLFSHVGMDQFQTMFPELMDTEVQNLPSLFTQSQLEETVRPLLEPGAVREALARIREGLMNLDEIGSARFIALDPLGLKDLVLARLSALAPVKEFRIHRGRLLSADSRHCMVMAAPKNSGTDSGFSAQAVALIRTVTQSMQADFARPGETVSLTSVGAFRAAYDNEQIVKQDVQKAIVIATAAIAMLLLLAFPRPWIGLLALVPALVGSIAGLFVYSLLYKSISLMVLGFGGAIISITVDHGIAYLLFLDRPHRALGRDASNEVWAVGLIATLTTVCAFLALVLSDFRILEELGKFTALGIGFSFLFIHTLFPRIIPALPPARPRKLPLKRVVNFLVFKGDRGAWFALAVFCILTWFAWPSFNADLSTMNTVSQETLNDDAAFQKVWGQGFTGKTHLMLTGDTVEDLQDRSDKLAGMITPAGPGSSEVSGFVLSMVFPGEKRKHQNQEAWTRFWTAERVGELRQTMMGQGEDLGFTPQAFEPFITILGPAVQTPGPVAISASLYPMLGISKSRDGSAWIQTTSLVRNPESDPREFRDRFSAVATVFDPGLFSSTLGGILFSTFVKMFVIIAATVLILLLVFFLDLTLTAMAMLPVVFAFVCTLGTMKLMGHALDIPSLMLSIIVFGMGIDYSLFFVRSYQRYRDESHPSQELVFLAVFMAGASTLVGFGAMGLARHSLLRSAGLTSLLGIGYSLAGTFLILPPLLRRWFIERPGTPVPDTSGVRVPGEGAMPVIVPETPDPGRAARVMARYRTLEAYPRMFTRFKIKVDPLFRELPRFLPEEKGPITVMDIGTGIGVPACFVLETYPASRVYGIEPDPESRRISEIAIAGQGLVTLGAAPDIPEVPGPARIALVLDMCHFLTDIQFAATLENIRENLEPGGHLVLRAVIPPRAKPSWVWHMEAMKLKKKGIAPHYRSESEIIRFINQAGFRVDLTEPSGNNPESSWFIAELVPSVFSNTAADSIQCC